MESERDELKQQMAKLTAALEAQNSLLTALAKGIFYGFGFFIGSAILAAVGVGLFVHFIGVPSWAQDAFQAGSSFGR